MTSTIILSFVPLFTASAKVTSCEDGHWVQSKSDNGEIVVLEDGSVWKINPVDRIITMLWLPTDSIVACPDKLINTDDGEVAEARQLR